MDPEPAAGPRPALPPTLAANRVPSPHLSDLENGVPLIASGLALRPQVPGTGFERGVCMSLWGKEPGHPVLDQALIWPKHCPGF